LWDFGDTGTSVLYNPSHSFATYGDYDVSLTITNPYGSDIKTYNDCVTIHYKVKYLSDEITIADSRTSIIVKALEDTIESAEMWCKSHLLLDACNIIQSQFVKAVGIDEESNRIISTGIDEWGNGIIDNVISEFSKRVLTPVTYDVIIGFIICRMIELTDDIKVESLEEKDT
jgi:PKD repeat protein